MEIKTIRTCTGKIAIVDSDVHELVKDMFWHDSDGKIYHDTNRNNRNTLHRLVIGNPPPGYVIDHINNDYLDNRRSNLRFATPAENSYNRSKINQGKTSSKYKGVCKRVSKRGKVRWRAMIQHKGKKINIGHYSTEVDAAHAYNLMAKKLFGEFAYLNKIKGE